MKASLNCNPAAALQVTWRQKNSITMSLTPLLTSPLHLLTKAALHVKHAYYMLFYSWLFFWNSASLIHLALKQIQLSETDYSAKADASVSPRASVFIQPFISHIAYCNCLRTQKPFSMKARCCLWPVLSFHSLFLSVFPPWFISNITSQV